MDQELFGHFVLGVTLCTLAKRKSFKDRHHLTGYFQIMANHTKNSKAVSIKKNMIFFFFIFKSELFWQNHCSTKSVQYEGRHLENFI